MNQPHDYHTETNNGGIRVWRRTTPAFHVQMIIEADKPEPTITFRGEWGHPNKDRMRGGARE
jgi:hypothetical protein